MKSYFSGIYMPFCKGIYPKTEGKTPKERKGVPSCVASLLWPVDQWVCSGNHQIPDRTKFSVTPFSTRTVLVPEHKDSLLLASAPALLAAWAASAFTPFHSCCTSATSSEKSSWLSYLPTSLSPTLYLALFFSTALITLHIYFLIVFYLSSPIDGSFLRAETLSVFVPGLE